MHFEDKTLPCADCGADFLHSAEDQARYAERGFTNDPKRCRPCREQRRARQEQQQGQRGGGGGQARQGGGGHGGDSGRRGGGGGGGRQQREFHETTCSQCGVTTTVPFRPVEGRPVYCRDCFRAMKD